MSRNGCYKALLYALANGLILVSLSACQKSLSEQEARLIIAELYDSKVPSLIAQEHLIQAGTRIVPYLLKEVRKKDVPKREQAILALGSIKDDRAVITLIQMFEDDSEPAWIREAALKSLWHIDKELAHLVSRRHETDSPGISAMVRQMEEDKF